MEKTIKPSVSVVTPVCNNAERLRQVLEALQAQTYPFEQYEVIVVDNGSTDRSPEVARTYDGVTVLYELENLSSPYSARNRGIEAASGDIVALLDATCVPSETWMEEGVTCMQAQQADLVGGAVDFDLDERPSCGEIYDAIANIKIRESIEERQVVPTANLFVRREVFEEIGLFPEGVRSGGDLQWTKRATSQGYRLVYGERAAVRKPARSFRRLLKKQWRVAKGQPAIWREEGETSPLLRSLKILLKPHGTSRISRWIDRRGQPYMRDYLYQLWLMSYVVKAVMFGGRTYASISDTLRAATCRTGKSAPPDSESSLGQ